MSCKKNSGSFFIDPCRKCLKIDRSGQSEVISKQNLWSLGGPTIRKVITIHLNYALTQLFKGFLSTFRRICVT